MKNLILILISCFAFSQDPAKPDTAKLSPELKTEIVKAEIQKRKAELLDQKLQQAEAEKKILQNKRASLLSRLKNFFHEYFEAGKDPAGNYDQASAVKEENRTEPVREIEVYDGTDTVRAGWFYRLFHKDDFVIRRFKIVNNEKVYLD